MALRNLQSNLHLILENIESRIENKIKSLRKTVLQIWYLIGQNMTLYVHNIIFAFVTQSCFQLFDFFCCWTTFSKSFYGPI